MPPQFCPRCQRPVPASAAVCPFDGTALSEQAWAEDTAPGSGGGAADSGKALAVPAPSGDVTAPAQAGVVPEPSVPRDTRPSASLTGLKLGDYEVLELIGSGGMGDVYLGEQKVIGKKVAIKVLKPVIAVEPEFVTRMLAEARAVNAIGHPNIVDIFNLGQLPDGRPYLVMDFLEGEPLDRLIDERGALPPIDVVEILEATCSALSAAHGAGIVHRDLKPANLFVSRDRASHAPYVKLLDFGLAKELTRDESRTQQGMVVGTPDYIAPEQATNQQVTPRTDLYSLGVMAFEMLTGQPPFAAPSTMELMLKHINQPPPRVSSLLPTVSATLDDLVVRMMAKAPGERPATAEAVRRELSRIRRELREGTTSISNLSAVRSSAQRLAPVPSAPRPPAPRASAPRASPVAAQGPVPGAQLDFSSPSPTPMDSPAVAPPPTQESPRVPGGRLWPLWLLLLAAAATAGTWALLRARAAPSEPSPAVAPAPPPEPAGPPPAATATPEPPPKPPEPPPKPAEPAPRPRPDRSPAGLLRGRLKDEEARALKRYPTQREEIVRRFGELSYLLGLDPSPKGVEKVGSQLDQFLQELH